MAQSHSESKSSTSAHNEILTVSGLYTRDEPDDDGQTVREIAEASGLSISTINSRIKRDIESGRVIVGKAIRTSDNGARSIQNVYRVNDKP